MPEDNLLCHGDFHPQNIIISQDKPIIIDWFDATQGHPLADVARTLLILNYGHLPTFIDAKLQSQINLIRKQFSDTYIKQYNKLRPIALDELEHWQLAIATTRLNEKISIDERKIMIDVIKKCLNK